MFQCLRKLFPPSSPVQYDPMKYLIIGLGNIGPKYDGTRHNIGFDVLDQLAKDQNSDWKSAQLGSVTEFKHKGRTIILLKPSTFMNLSGKSVNHWMQKHKIPKEKILVVVDDLNLDLGSRRLRAKGSDGGHNGLKDIQGRLGTSAYPRLRLGIGNDYSRGRQVDFVLGTWESDEQDEVNEMITSATKCILSFCSLEFKYAMENCNAKR